MPRRVAVLAGLLAALAALAPATAAARSDHSPAPPPWEAAQRMQDLVFDAQTALLLDEPRSALRLAARRPSRANASCRRS